MGNTGRFNLIVIGGGTGGNGVARMAANAGWTVASIDSLPFGGTCALRGCDPKKMLIAVTEGVEWARNLDGKGLVAQTSVNWPDMIAFKRTFTDAMPDRIEGGLDKAGITVLHGEARFTGRDKIEVSGEVLSARHFHIATGARPMTLNIPGEELLATSTDFLALPERPDRVVFVGGGFIAMEFAHIAKRAGAREVTVLEMMERPLGNFDPDLVAILSEATADLGVDLRTEAKVLKIEKNGTGFTVAYETPTGVETVDCDLVVHATGRVPNIDHLNLEAAGVEYSRMGIKVSPFMRTTNPAIFAAGDCADSGPMLTPVSANEGRIAAKNLLAGKDEREVNYPPIPSVVFTLPQLASVGLSEAAAREEGLDFDTYFDKTAGWYSSLRVGAKHTAYKVLVEKGTGKILGAHLIGPGAEEQINLFAMAMAAGLTANQIKGLIFAYPSFASDISSMI
ncbi:NAD(P)/FAD-dependent oxidoreductase (plasmid) [Nitratireductor rhodophyticola]|uniref:NAD(P)/FAD-dependent oxidoreductase n=1 Tax=Nitratireductor rhodophyticola TaxID=2854036 RepID=A0ABS7RD48_9HYPH|nr:NAD(P)/FAD-dependent oxidoreductase [Nitratireductor rhodophyticola]MBY8918842.1 NAD(P)/FAD-dependent oxidoreductase [Nitratireductor rhodophyticola]MBY8923103.1 NAD(P)/FAD-dependent oxidoreductase [Nitratireductor rhodophyticola]MEC9246787.1 NAD(P)/FAD-dependent oxidoreductase [Pseudomonadota bacterium]WPZ16282.1 NAD(P)/FAD-dependent oxidoreductase [Nitratireductor rhodophyticola]